MMTGTGTDLSRTTWHKSSHSGGGNQCVEVAQVDATRTARGS